MGYGNGPSSLVSCLLIRSRGWLHRRQLHMSDISACSVLLCWQTEQRR